MVCHFNHLRLRKPSFLGGNPLAARRDSSGSVILSGTAAQRLGISSQRLRQLHESGVFKADRITYEGVGLYYADSVEEFRRLREGFAVAAPRLKAEYRQVPREQIEIELPDFRSLPESVVE